MTTHTKPDEVRWSLSSNKRFSTFSMYKALEHNLASPNNRWIWKAQLANLVQLRILPCPCPVLLSRPKLGVCDVSH
jgi:hypothetical protein